MAKIKWIESGNRHEAWLLEPYEYDGIIEFVEIRRHLNGVDLRMTVFKGGTVHMGANALIVFEAQDMLEWNLAVQQAFQKMNPISEKKEILF